ncbi:alpha-(1-_3)-arabinofuranosyltransferase family protein [Blastococcus sp. URHD0036]|uniref:alpha-(1->3)-arabinofuranosyltransferase domain-containing protein n=1 Tax=Blastococcus sp. URHD0036 TaxID=1380356 RepID=UPI00068CC2DD|nr:alpha-(1->3)-arabinofuranosyltransferase family protein [Blastococcus sp. URHD0036]
MATIVDTERTATPEAQVPAPAGSPVPLRTRAAGLLVRGRLAVVCAGFVVFSLLQAPGRVLGDTKIDLLVDPVGFLSRALTLWEPLGSAGQVQNQAYGYFFPMGPFFALGDVVGLPTWIVQRLWWALIMSVAFLGVVALARRLRIGTPATALFAGLVYALAPRIVSEIGQTSSELIPMALAPWVIVPLAGLAHDGSTRPGQVRRAALLSGVAVFCVGGVNAVATAAVLPLAALFLLTRPAGPVRRRLVAWWVAAVALAIAWWAGPLVLLGKFAPPFLYYIENAQATTGPNEILGVVRGTSHWIAEMASPYGPAWPSGWALVHQVLPIAGTVVLAAAAFAGLCRRDLPERRWLVLGLVAGVALVSMGHLASVDGLWAGALHDALDDSLAPIRNVHKFEPIVRLPLVLGLAHLGAVLLRWARRRRPALPARHEASRRTPAPPRRVLPRLARGGSRLVLLAVVAALVATVSPALAGRLAPPTGFTGVPGYWQQTADYLADQQETGRALLVPGSSFATYEWGNTNDEVIQPLAESAWDVRSAIPLSPEGHIRVLDAIEERLALGEGSEGLTRYLARAGISHLVLRNDLATGESRSTRSILVRQALAESPGITLAATFGPVGGTADVPDDLVSDAGLDEPAPAIEVYSVAGTVPRAWTAPLSDAVTVVGGPEAVLELEERGLITGRPTLMAGSPEATGTPMVTDALVRRERNFGRLDGATSAGLTVDDPRRLETPVRDYVVPDASRAESVVRYIGAEPSASSSASDASGFVATRLDSQPWSAVDGDPTTAWRPAPWDESGQAPWWRLTTEQQFLASTVVVALGQEPGVARPTELRLTTDAGEAVVPVADTGEEQVLTLPPGYTSTLTIAATSTADTQAMALANVRLPGVDAQRSVLVPRAGDGEPVAVYAFDAQRGRAGCVVDATGAPRCAGALMTGAEEPVFLDRSFWVEEWADYDARATAVARPGAALDALLTSVRGTIPVTASSSAVADPRGSAVAALDGDPSTTWIAAGDDQRPSLTLTFPQPRTVDSLRVLTSEGVTAARPRAVTIDDGGGLPRTLPLADDGTVRFAPVVTDRLTVTFDLADDVRSIDPLTRWEQTVGVGVSELEVGAPNPVTDPATPVTLPCGTGPTVRVDAAILGTVVFGTVGELLAGEPIATKPCDAVPALRLPAGEHRVVSRSSDTLAVDSVTLSRFGRAVKESSAVVRTPAEPSRWDAEHRVVEVAEREEPTLLVIPENPNLGWTAQLDGQELEKVTVDGWQQGYVLPAGPAGTVRLDYPPGAEYRQTLAVGAGAVVVLGILTALPARRPGRGGPRRRRTGLLGVLPGVLAGVAVVAAAVLGTAVVGGLFALAALAVLWVFSQLAGSRRGAVLGTVAVVGLLVAGALLLADPDGTEDPRQVAAVLGLTAVVAGVLPVLPVLPWRRRTASGGPAPRSAASSS